MKKTLPSPPAAGTPRIFDTNKRIRLGIWGLGRGLSFFSTCKLLNIDVVAGCDYNEHMRKNFLAGNPGAYVTDDAAEFLKQDFNAVLLATFCLSHGKDAIRCLQAGKHVLSEVIACTTLAEGVRLVEEVEKSKRVYQLAENYPFTAANMYLARKWREGLFGDLMYAEYEYVHECRSLCYTYIDGLPVQPGHTLHNWRSWFDFHYYCTHSLGPVMVITGTRPVRVVAFPSRPKLAGYVIEGHPGMGHMAPSLIQMSNGGVVRNLMGAGTNDSHVQRLWGTLGAAEMGTGKGLQLRLGGAGAAPKMEVAPQWDELGDIAAKTGHGGGDFWTLYYFAREIFYGTPGPFNVYAACDVTLPGILALRSSCANGKAFDVPDFRKKSERAKYRNDNWRQKPYDTLGGVFPAGADRKLTQHFTGIISRLIQYSPLYRACADWRKVIADVVDKDLVFKMLDEFIGAYPALRETYAAARKLADAYPGSDGARVLREMLALGEEHKVMAAGFLAGLERQRNAFNRSYALLTTAATGLRPAPGNIRKVRPPAGAPQWRPVPQLGALQDVRSFHNNREHGLLYLRGTLKMARAGRGTLSFGSDGPVKVWFNGKAVACEPGATNPCIASQYKAPVKVRKGNNAVLFALVTNRGKAWGIMARLSMECRAGMPA